MDHVFDSGELSLRPIEEQYFISFMAVDNSVLFFFPDPLLWTPCHVALWLEWVVNEYGLHHIDLGKFSQVAGTELCKMSVEELSRYTTRYNSEVLVQHLKFLKQGELRSTR